MILTVLSIDTFFVIAIAVAGFCWLLRITVNKIGDFTRNQILRKWSGLVLHVFRFQSLSPQNPVFNKFYINLYDSLTLFIRLVMSRRIVAISSKKNVIGNGWDIGFVSTDLSFTNVNVCAPCVCLYGCMCLSSVAVLLFYTTLFISNTFAINIACAKEMCISSETMTHGIRRCRFLAWFLVSGLMLIICLLFVIKLRPIKWHVHTDNEVSVFICYFDNVSFQYSIEPCIGFRFSGIFPDIRYRIRSVIHPIRVKSE